MNKKYTYAPAPNSEVEGIPCPECGSTKTTVTNNKVFVFSVLAGGGFIMTCLATVLIFTLPALIVTIPMMLLSPLALFAKGATGSCLKCKHRFPLKEVKPNE